MPPERLCLTIYCKGHLLFIHYPFDSQSGSNMSAILSADDLNDFISPGLACIKPVETLPKQAPEEINVCRPSIFLSFLVNEWVIGLPSDNGRQVTK